MTSYSSRIRNWTSDVCSSYLGEVYDLHDRCQQQEVYRRIRPLLSRLYRREIAVDREEDVEAGEDERHTEIGELRRHRVITGLLRLLLAAVERPGEQLFIAVDPRPRGMVLLALRRQEIGGDHWRDHARDRQADAIGRAHVSTSVSYAPLVYRLLLVTT